ncbi:hypothetical protein BKA65DRAFT_520950 [Rhexocercosporidium sp. MPI-PUGE-AT-0058]|nr:hypothetical protein BKA65DRAFT_520950 [Rhexocercosporidium sp. MPI-PUGE-AT-0058]
MVKRATEEETRAWAALPSSTEMAIRRISSVFLMGALLTILTPFAPFSWVIPAEGPELLDTFMSPVLVLGALYSQWRIAGVVQPVAVEIADVVFMYRQVMYWQLAFLEIVICVAVNWGKNEIYRRFASVGVVAGLWAIGWFATPLKTKMVAWEHIKWIWTWMAFNEARRVVGGGGRRRY